MRKIPVEFRARIGSLGIPRDSHKAMLHRSCSLRLSVLRPLRAEGRGSDSLRRQRPVVEGCKIGILFGRERAGLSNEDLFLAKRLIRIPSNSIFSSLNLAESVLLIRYQLNVCSFEKSAGSFQANVPITKANSTSQSSFFESFGISISSFGPQIELVAFIKTIGSVGVLAPVSLA